jgi:DHA1 family tetracycline resistance protein-like MFS transporter
MPQNVSSSSSNRFALTLIFFVVLIDQIGWGMVIPILPTYAKAFQAGPVAIGWLLASYSIVQFFCAPLLGRWSDRIGRKPILVVSILGTVLASAATGFASTMHDLSAALIVLFVARMLDGATGGNTATALSYAADVTTPEKRAQGLGMVGAAVGLGYTIGPAFGGLIAQRFGPATPFYVAAAVALVNMFVMWGLLPETISPELRRRAEEKGRVVVSLLDALRNPNINGLLIVQFLIIFAASCYQMMMPLFTNVKYGFTEHENGYLFAFLGLTTTFVQGGLIRPLVKRAGEAAILAIGLALLFGSLAVTPLAASVAALAWFSGGLAAGTALCNPTILALISRRTQVSEQGEALGFTASMASLARIAAPAWGGYAMKHVGPPSPFYSGAVACAVALGLFGLIALRAGNHMRPEANPS